MRELVRLREHLAQGMLARADVRTAAALRPRGSTRPRQTRELHELEPQALALSMALLLALLLDALDLVGLGMTACDLHGREPTGARVSSYLAPASAGQLFTSDTKKPVQAGAAIV